MPNNASLNLTPLAHKDLGDDASAIGSILRRARENAGLSRAAAAQQIGVDPQTLYRWEEEDGAPKADVSRILRAEAAYGVDLVSALRRCLGVAVPRGTSPGAKFRVPPRLAPRIELFERDVIRMGADDFEVDHIRDVLRSSETASLFRGSAAGARLTPEEEESELEILFDSLRAWVRRRIERRVMARAGEATATGAPRLELREPQRSVILTSKRGTRGGGGRRR